MNSQSFKQRTICSLNLKHLAISRGERMIRKVPGTNDTFFDTNFGETDILTNIVIPVVFIVIGKFQTTNLVEIPTFSMIAESPFRPTFQHIMSMCYPLVVGFRLYSGKG